MLHLGDSINHAVTLMSRVENETYREWNLLSIGNIIGRYPFWSQEGNTPPHDRNHK
jgi:hypothetical protein